MSFMAKAVGVVLLGLVTLSVLSIFAALFWVSSARVSETATITAEIVPNAVPQPPPAVAVISTDGAIVETPPDVIYPPMPTPRGGHLTWLVFVRLALLAGSFTVFLAGLWFLSRLFSGARSSSKTEVELMQEIHSGLGRMESRVESLETLMVDSEKESPAR